MEKLESVRREIVGSVIKSVYRSVKPTDEFWFDGLGNLLSYIFVLELENEKRFEFSYKQISAWDNRLKISKQKLDSKTPIIGLKVIDIISDKPSDGKFFLVEGDVVLYHDDDFGSELALEKYSDVFDKNGDLL